MHSRAKTYQEYLDQLTPEGQEVIEYLTKLIVDELPEVKIVMHWGMPVAKKKDDFIVAFAVQKYYYTIYLWTMDWRKKYEKKLGGVNFGKGCLRFRNLKQLPEPILRDIFQQAGKR